MSNGEGVLKTTFCYIMDSSSTIFYKPLKSDYDSLMTSWAAKLRI